MYLETVDSAISKPRQKPGKVRFAYNPPSPIDIIADGSAVVVRDRALETSDYYPLSQTPLRYLLADHIDLLRDTDVVSVSADDTFITVVIEETRLLTGTSRLMTIDLVVRVRTDVPTIPG
jgi:outer membrane lipoprotein-sorting protein